MSNKVWTDTLRLIADNTPVDGATVNAALRPIITNEQYLKSRLDMLIGGKALLETAVPTDASVKVGMPVYFDGDKYKPAMAAAVWDPGGRYFVASDSSYVWGVCISRSDDTLADIMLSGINEFDATTFAEIVEGGVGGPGPYYLSASQPGKLRKGRTPLGVFVGYMGGDNKFRVMPTPYEDLTRHIHFRFELDPNNWVAEGDFATEFPGIEPPKDDQGVVIAKWGYKISADTELAAKWPPIPLKSAYLECYSKSSPYTQVDIEQFAIFDPQVIWVTVSMPNPSETTSGTRLWFSRLITRIGDSIVTSLTPKNSSISLKNGQGGDATAGDLILGLNWEGTVHGTDHEGHIVVKSMDADGIHYGPVIEKLTEGTGVSISTVNGEATISADSSGSWNGPVDLVHLTNAHQEIVDGVPMIVFPNHVKSIMWGKVSIPLSLPSTPQIQIRLGAWPKLGGNIHNASWTFRYRLVAPSIPTAIGTDLFGDFTTFDPATDPMIVNDAVLTEVQSIGMYSPPMTGIESYAGGVLYFQLERNATGDADSCESDISIYELRYHIGAVGEE